MINSKLLPGFVRENHKAKHGEVVIGYDSIFKPIGFENTFAEMTLAQKNKIGHRGKAVTQLITFLNNKKTKPY